MAGLWAAEVAKVGGVGGEERRGEHRLKKRMRFDEGTQQKKKKKLTELPGEGEADHPGTDDGDIERGVFVFEMRRGQGGRRGR